MEQLHRVCRNFGMSLENVLPSPSEEYRRKSTEEAQSNDRIVTLCAGLGESIRTKGESYAQLKIPCSCFCDRCFDVWSHEPLADAGARQFSADHHDLNRSISDGPRRGDCNGTQCRPELHFKQGKGAGSWTARL